MKKHVVSYLVLATLFVAGMLIAGCSKSPTSTDEDVVRGLLLSSQYTSPDDGPGTFNDGTTSPYLSTGAPVVNLAFTDSVWVKFARKVNLPVETSINIEMPAPGGGAGTAKATIIHYPTGTFFVDHTNNDSVDVLTRPIDGVATRTVYLTRTGLGRWNGWRIDSLSVMEHVSARSTVAIDSVKAWGSSHTFPEFVVRSGTQMIAKAQLPTFAPGDEVTVQVWTHNTDTQGSWAFLHRGSGTRKGHVAWHHRDPFYSEDSTNTVFQRVWSVSDDPNQTLPRVCSSAVDVIDWSTLFGGATDSISTYYNCRIWGLPYLVKQPDQQVPDDTE